MVLAAIKTYSRDKKKDSVLGFYHTMNILWTFQGLKII